MSATITIPVWAPTLLVVGGLLAGAVIMLFFDRQTLADVIAGHRLLASADKRSARWLFLKGYRKTPHAGPDLTDEPEVLALSDRSHADEQADHADTDRRGMWRVLLGLASDLVDRAHDWLPGLLRQRAERDKFGSGEQATSEDPFAELLAHVEAKPLVLDIADEAELDEQRAEWVALNPPTLGPDGQRHWNDVTAMHEVVVQGRHRKMPINVPAQRTGDEA